MEFQECPKFKILSEILFRLFYICLWFFILISCLWFSFEVYPVLVKWKSGALCSWTMSDQMAAQLNLWRHYVIMWFRHVTKCKQDPPRPRSMSSDFKMNYIGLRRSDFGNSGVPFFDVRKIFVFEKSCDLSD